MSSTHTLPANISNLEGGETMLTQDKENFCTPGENELTTLRILYRTFQPLNQRVASLILIRAWKLICFVPGEHGFSSFQVENIHCKYMCAAHLQSVSVSLKLSFRSPAEKNKQEQTNKHSSVTIKMRSTGQVLILSS